MVQKENAVAADDGVQSVSDSQHGGALELFRDQFLHGLLSDHIDVGSSLVEDNKLVALQDGTDDANQLAFADGKVFALLLDLEMQTFAIFFLFLSVFLGVFLYVFFVRCGLFFSRFFIFFFLV